MNPHHLLHASSESRSQGTEAQALLGEIWQALQMPGEPEAPRPALTVTGEGDLLSVYGTTDLAVASIAAAALAAASYVARRQGGGPPPAVTVDRVLASHWFKTSIAPQGWPLPPAWDPIAGDYQAGDGRWIRLHTNAPHHRRAALQALGLLDATGADDPGLSPARVVEQVRAEPSAAALEARVVAAGGVAAEMRDEAAWQAHPQGQAVAAEPLIAWASFDGSSGAGSGAHQAQSAAARTTEPGFDASRPLQGVRVLDLTRILAGPVATRYLASLGAEVLRIDPPGWDEPLAAPEVTLGKRRGRLDLKSADGLTRFAALLAGADVLVHGYRADALARLGLDEARRQQIRPGLVDVSLNAYGWTGPWRERRGFDSLVQMSTGIAAAGQALRQADRPTPLPVQALDHATGYLMAAAVLRGLSHRLGVPASAPSSGMSARLSLARCAHLLCRFAPAGARTSSSPPRDLAAGDYAAATELTAWGPARRLKPPYAVAGVAVGWELPAGPLGDGPAAWLRAD